MTFHNVTLVTMPWLLLPLLLLLVCIGLRRPAMGLHSMLLLNNLLTQLVLLGAIHCCCCCNHQQCVVLVTLLLLPVWPLVVLLLLLSPLQLLTLLPCFGQALCWSC